MTTIVVTAAVIERHGRFLVTKRQPGVHLAGRWEFPGGKCDAGESLHVCVIRELHEELGVEASVGRELLSTTYDYPERQVEVHFLQCELQGEPSPQVGQEMRWVSLDELRELDFPPADAELIRLLVTPSERKAGA
jgi:8-oxo-dGTP diphosphatase